MADDSAIAKAESLIAQFLAGNALPQEIQAALDDPEVANLALSDTRIATLSGFARGEIALREQAVKAIELANAQRVEVQGTGIGAGTTVTAKTADGDMKVETAGAAGVISADLKEQTGAKTVEGVTSDQPATTRYVTPKGGAMTR